MTLLEFAKRYSKRWRIILVTWRRHKIYRPVLRLINIVNKSSFELFYKQQLGKQLIKYCQNKTLWKLQRRAKINLKIIIMKWYLMRQTKWQLLLYRITCIYTHNFLLCLDTRSVFTGLKKLLWIVQLSTLMITSSKIVWLI